jgi:hypothetical protein
MATCATVGTHLGAPGSLEVTLPFAAQRPKFRCNYQMPIAYSARVDWSNGDVAVLRTLAVALRGLVLGTRCHENLEDCGVAIRPGTRV